MYYHQYQRCHGSKISGLMTQCFYVKRRKLRRKSGWMIVNTPCELKVVGASQKNNNWDDGSCRSCCRWNGTILDSCSCVPVDLFADWRFMPNLWRNRTVHFSVWGIRSEGSIRIKACFDLRSLRVKEISNVVSSNAVQWQEECNIWSQPKNGCI